MEHIQDEAEAYDISYQVHQSVWMIEWTVLLSMSLSLIEVPNFIPVDERRLQDGQELQDGKDYNFGTGVK